MQQTLNGFEVPEYNRANTHNTMCSLLSVPTGLGLLAATVLSLTAAESTPTDSEIKLILRERIDQAKKGVGIVVGLVDAHGTRIVSHGGFEPGQGREVDGDTVFEIGSITKVFTSLVLADIVVHGEANLNDPIIKCLPGSVTVPKRNGKQITLVDLATHTSGLPRMPDNFHPKDAENPYADYTLDQMYEFLSNYTLPRDIGSEYEYSNYGAALLGQMLSLKSGTNYEELVERRVCRPLGMTNTAITLHAEMKARFAPGHNRAGRPVANWDLPTFAGAGALRSTDRDLLKFAAANLGLTKTSLEAAMELQQTPLHTAGSPTMRIGLAWHIANKFGTELIWHNGGTGGYHSFIGLDKRRKLGVVVLANSENSIDDIGFHLLETKCELAHFAAATNRVKQ
jgi:D-alanyl-D-alanine-carboxypeptidase/D-alanyl-D-alanine-endopeptidase